MFYILINFKLKAFNYRRIWFWHMLSLFGVFWVGLIATLDLVTSEHFAYVILMFVGWISLIIFGVFIQKKWFPSRLKLEKHVNLQGLFQWAYRPSNTVAATRNWFRSQVIYGEEEVKEGHPHYLRNKVGIISSYSEFDQNTNYKGRSGSIIPDREDSDEDFHKGRSGNIIPDREDSDEDFQ